MTGSLPQIVIDLFAGPGGWDEGARLAGYVGDLIGVEHDLPACRTAHAAGHVRVQADVSRLDPRTFVQRSLSGGPVVGLIASPPCPTFSSAGHRAGQYLTDILTTAMTRAVAGEHVVAQTRRDCGRLLRAVALARYPKRTRVQRSAWARRNAVLSTLIVEPLRWVHELRPTWVACEQVPEALPLWQHAARLLRQLGYRTWCGVLSTERYGVPQTRRRAILIAHLHRPVGPPAPTHQAYRVGHPPVVDDDLFGPALPPPVSMADALPELFDRISRPARTVCGDRSPRWAYGEGASSYGTGWTLANGRQPNATTRTDGEPAPTVYCSRPGNLVLRSNYGSDGDPDNRGERSISEPALTVTGRARGASWIVDTNTRTGDDGDMYARPVNEPAPTVTGNGNRWRLYPSGEIVVDVGQNSRTAGGGSAPFTRSVDAPAPTTVQPQRWQVRPATTVQGDPRIWPPGHKVNGADAARLGETAARTRYGDRAGTDALRVTVHEAAILQGFRPGYPWTGTKSEQYRQVGDAVPPPFAAAILRPLLGGSA